MKKQVSIARALKEKNRVAGRLAKAREIIQQENSKDKSLPRRVDVEATYAEAKMLEGGSSPSSRPSPRPTTKLSRKSSSWTS